MLRYRRMEFICASGQWGSKYLWSRVIDGLENISQGKKFVGSFLEGFYFVLIVILAIPLIYERILSQSHVIVIYKVNK